MLDRARQQEPLPLHAIRFSLDASADEPIAKGDIRTLFNSVQTLLGEIERSVTGEPAVAQWKWEESNYHIPLSATVNGVDAATLSRIARTAQAGFERAYESSDGSGFLESGWWLYRPSGDRSRRSVDIGVKTMERFVGVLRPRLKKR